ncbi:helix-turn-helix domain-containing protein [Butyrivibrio sp. AE3004]|uniref:helix-turn-helix domain-containing protein n=1 Tax=Butyrivibrio sp. AE3004 TaxID=1506994 RepID=UPI00068A8934|nr:helix-turn-helix transcriptional regulator [Butyrivibrio sp. AE3004]
MLDQTKTGMFICDLRKEKGLTQKQLADEIGVSDKTISKWENGHGMPDTSIMPDLCRVLEININELLSGEHLTTENYNGKAEDNMVKLIKNSEDEKKKEQGRVIGTIIGLFLLVLFLYIIILVSSGGSNQVLWFLDAPSLVAVLGFQLIGLAASGQFYNFFRGIKITFAPKSVPSEELPALAQRLEYAVGFGIRLTILAGAISSLIGFVLTMQNLSSPETIGPTMAVCVLTLFYACLIALFMYVIKGRLHRISES